MLVHAITNSVTDIPYWICRRTFYDYFDQADFLSRDVESVEQYYRSDWFHQNDGGTLGLIIPVVSAINRRTDMIGTRHRLAVLLPHLAEIPVAFAMGYLMKESREFLNQIPKRSLDVDEPFWIPDLPVKGVK